MIAKSRSRNRLAGALAVAFGLGFIVAVGIPFSAGDTPGAECEGLSEEPCYDLSETLPPDLGAIPAISINMETLGTEDGPYDAPDGTTELFGCEEPYCPNMLNEPPDPELVGIIDAVDEHTTTNGPDSSGVRVCRCDVPGWPPCSLVTVLNNGLQDASPALQLCFNSLGSRWGSETMEIPPGFYALRTPVRLVNTTPFLKILKVQGVPLHSAPCFNQFGTQTNACAILIAHPDAVGWGGDIQPWGKSIGLLSVEGQDIQMSHIGVHGNRGARITRPAPYDACHRQGIPGKYRGVNIGVTCDRCQFLNGYSGHAICASGLLWANYHNGGNYRQTRWGMVRANLFTHNGASQPDEVADGATFYSASGIPGHPFYVGLNGAINNSDIGYGVFGARDGAIFEHNGVIQTTSSTNYLYAGFILEARPSRSPVQGFNDFTGAVFRYNWMSSSYGPGTSFDPIDFGFQVGGDPWFSPLEDAFATGGVIHDNHFYEVKQPVNVARSLGVRVNGVNASWINPVGCPALGVPYGQGSGCSVPGWLRGPIPLTSCGDGRHPTSRFNLSLGRGPHLGYPALQPSQLAAGSVGPTTYWNWENCY